MTQTPDNNGNIISSEGDGPGIHLRRAREALGLHLRDIAHELHLDVWMLEALEADDFEALGAPVFAKGHMRQYALLLGLVPDDLMIAYYRVRGRNDTPPAPITTTMARQGNRRSVPWAGVLIAAAVIILLAIILWFIAGRSPTVTASAPGGGPDDAASLGIAEETQETGRSMVTETNDVPLLDNRVKTDMTETAPSPTDVSATDTATSGPIQNTATGTQLPETETSIVSDAADEPATGDSAQTARVTPPLTTNRVVSPTKQPSSSTVQLSLTFGAESWVEILDRNGNRLIYTMIPAGRTRTVSGDGPLEIFLGNSRDVRVDVNGAPFAIPAASIRGNTARFFVNTPTS